MLFSLSADYCHSKQSHNGNPKNGCPEYRLECITGLWCSYRCISSLIFCLIGISGRRCFCLCTILLYCTGMVLGLAALVVALLGVAVLVTYSLQNGIILLVIAFLISPMGLPTAAAWLLGKVQGLRYAIQDRIYR